MNRTLRRIAAGLFIWGMGESLFIFFLSIYLGQLGANPVAIGSILSGMGVMMVISHIPAGHLADRMGRRPLIMAGWIVGILSAALMALARSLPLFVAGLWAYGSTAFIMSPLNSYVTAARGDWSINKALALTSASFALGSVIGPLTGGWIGEQFGLRSVFGVASGIFVLSTIVMYGLPPQPRDHHDPEGPPLRLLSNYRYLGMVALIFVVVFALSMPTQFTPNFLQDVRGLSLTQIGILGTFGVLGNALLAMAFGTWFSPRAGMLIGQVLVGAFVLLIWRTAGLPLYALAYLLLGGFRGSRPMMNALARGLVHPSQMGLAFGLTETVASISLTLAPLIAGLLYNTSPALMYPVGLGMIALAFVLTLWLAPHPGVEHA